MDMQEYYIRQITEELKKQNKHLANQNKHLDDIREALKNLNNNIVDIAKDFVKK